MKRIKINGHKLPPAVLSECMSILARSGVVIFPSDTVYGMLVDASSPEAVQKVFTIKKRPAGKPISVFVPDIQTIEKLCVVSDKERALITKTLPGPFTLILQSRHGVCPLLESEAGALGVRIPQFAPVQALMQTYQKPVTATSANTSGASPHYSIESILADFSPTQQEQIDLIIDAGTLPRNKPSTVVDITEGTVSVLRKGDLVLGAPQTTQTASPQESRALGASCLPKNRVTSPLVLLLEGDLGAGKTQFVKGVAEAVGITDIISPTFVIYYEYALNTKARPFKKLYHFDLYNIQDASEFDHLGIERIMQEPAIICVEWGEKTGTLFHLFKNAQVLYVTIEHAGKHAEDQKRQITIQEVCKTS